MKKIALIGASGFIGSAILKEALGRGHTVSAIVRNENHVTVRHPRLTVTSVDVMDTNRLTFKLSCNDAVISAYNPGWDNPGQYEDMLVGNDSIIYATEQSGTPRLLMVGGAGGLFLSSGIRLMDTDIVPPAYLPAARGMEKVYTDYLLPNDHIDWVFFSPAAVIIPAPSTGKYRLGKNKLISDELGVSHITLGDYAMAMINELEAPRHHHEQFTIGY